MASTLLTPPATEGFGSCVQALRSPLHGTPGEELHPTRPSEQIAEHKTPPGETVPSKDQGQFNWEDHNSQTLFQACHTGESTAESCGVVGRFVAKLRPSRVSTSDCNLEEPAAMYSYKLPSSKMCQAFAWTIFCARLLQDALNRLCGWWLQSALLNSCCRISQIECR